MNINCYRMRGIIGIYHRNCIKLSNKSNTITNLKFYAQISDLRHFGGGGGGGEVA